MKDFLSCKDDSVVYCATCLKCQKQDVGSTVTEFCTRWSNPKSHINTKRKTCTFAKHFVEQKCGLQNLSPIWTGGGFLRFFLHNSKTPGDIEKKLSDFNFTPLTDILHILSITIVVRCCHSNLLFPVCHVIFWVEKTKKLELFSR